jgi:RimJ/RimL family protein N-acetyltransferase
MHEAISRVIDFGFNDIKFKVITARPKKGNTTSSIKLLLKNNFLLDTKYKFANKQEAQDFKIYYLTKSHKADQPGSK